VATTRTEDGHRQNTKTSTARRNIGRPEKRWRDIYCRSYSSESGDKHFPAEGDICAPGILLFVEAECCGLGVK
jgi:hypothetical protein